MQNDYVKEYKIRQILEDRFEVQIRYNERGWETKPMTREEVESFIEVEQIHHEITMDLIGRT